MIILIIAVVIAVVIEMGREVEDEENCTLAGGQVKNGSTVYAVVNNKCICI